MTRLNVGSGQRKFGGDFVNIDVNPKWEPDIVADGAHLPMFEDGSVDMIVLHHVLEHYGCGEAAGLIEECHRILKPGGSLLVFVPDMAALVQGWLQGRVTTQIFMTNVYGAYMNNEADRHKWGYDYKSLSHFLQVFGFYTIPCGRSVIPPDADIAQDWWILGIWGTK